MPQERIIEETKAGSIDFKVLLGGREVPASEEVLSIVTHKEVNRIPVARLVLRDGDAAQEDFPKSNTGDYLPGKEIEIKAGYDGKTKTIFKGIIVRHGIKIKENGMSFLHLECRDKAVKMTIGRQNKQFNEVKDSDVMEELISGHGLTASVESTSVKHKEMVQFYCTDWDFLMSRAEMNGKLVLVNDGEISVKAPVYSGNPVLETVFGDSLYEFEADMDARHQFKGVKATAWDPAKQAVADEEASAPAANSLGNLSESDLAKVINLASLDYWHGGQVLPQELKAWADAQLIKSHLAKIIGRAKIRGFNNVKPGDLVGLNGVGDRFTGKGYVTGVRQEWMDGAWYTHIQFGRLPEWFYREFEIQERPASGLLPGVNGLQTGIVSKLEGDPDGEFRIQVKLPLVDPAGDGLWARLASLDAGKDRGYVFRPEVNDEVVVGFLHGDPRDPIVLGQLHSSKLPAPIEAKDDNHEKGLTTRSKMRLHFDDQKKILTLETPTGKKVVLDEDAKNILIQDENGNKITIDSKGIALESAKDIILKATGDVKVEGVNIQHKAQAQFKAEGSAGLEVSSSAIATVKGSLVKIN